MGSFYRRPEEVRLEISNGNWLLVRKHLTNGEVRQAYARSLKAGTQERDHEQIGIADAVTYLIDWSITDVDDKPIVIRGKSYEFVAAALLNMTFQGANEIIQAIVAHSNAMTAELELEKKDPVGMSARDPTSISAA